jgi:thiamine biosynthesis lipoprotein
MQRHTFSAMGTWVDCLVEATPSPVLDAAFRQVEQEFARLERKLSRFRADSELSRLNRERSIEASDDLLELTRLALEAREQTGGRFDPTLHDAIVAAGYDRTFSELSPETPLSAVRPHRAGGEVRISGRRIELGPGASLDFGGLAKGYAADRCLTRLARLGAALVNAGGDLAVSGPRMDGPWPVGVALPGGVPALSLAIAQGGLATSARDRRRWVRDGEERHHIIDPRTLRSAKNTPLSVTAAARTATDAEIAAKALFLAGPDAGREAETANLPAVISWDDGRTQLVGITGPGADHMEEAA